MSGWLLEKKCLYLLVRVLMDLKHLPKGNSSKRWLPGCVEQRWISSFDVEIQFPLASLAGRIVHIVCLFLQ